MNPTVSLVMFFTGKMSLLRMFIYWAAQFLGAFLAALIVYIQYYDLINLAGKTLLTARIFATFPNTESIGWATCFLEQVIGSSFLIMSALAITDKNNQEHSNTVNSLLIGLVIFITGAAFSGNCSGAINPARDFSPRMFTLLAGWEGVFSASGYFFWIPLIGPFCGATIGMFIYTIVIGNNWP